MKIYIKKQNERGKSMKQKRIAMLLGTAMLTMSMTVPAFAAELGEGAPQTAEVQEAEAEDTDVASDAFVEDEEKPDEVLEDETNSGESEEEGEIEENNVPDPWENVDYIPIPESVKEQMGISTFSSDGGTTPTTKPGKWIQASDGRWWYKHSDGSYTKSAWEYINGAWYHFDAAGWMQTGWLKDGSKWYYLKDSGAMATGWVAVGGKWYYMSSSGAMMTGWVSVGGKWYYMNSSGAMLTGTQVIDGVTYTFASSGELTSNNAPSNKGKQIADYAIQFVGNPYVYGGTSLTNGADCSGFVQSVFKHFGINLPRTTYEQVKAGTAVTASNLQPGDLVFYYDGPGHVAIYIGNNQIVHAANSNRGIVTDPISYWEPPVAYRHTW